MMCDECQSLQDKVKLLEAELVEKRELLKYGFVARTEPVSCWDSPPSYVMVLYMSE